LPGIRTCRNRHRCAQPDTDIHIATHTHIQAVTEPDRQAVRGHTHRDIHTYTYRQTTANRQTEPHTDWQTTEVHTDMRTYIQGDIHADT